MAVDLCQYLVEVGGIPVYCGINFLGIIPWYHQQNCDQNYHVGSTHRALSDWNQTIFETERIWSTHWHLSPKPQLMIWKHHGHINEAQNA